MPIRGGITGAATPNMTVIPDPPPQVDVGLKGSADVAATGSFQLFAAHTFPAASTETSVNI